jgi:hypothetical protein
LFSRYFAVKTQTTQQARRDAMAMIDLMTASMGSLALTFVFTLFCSQNTN